MELSSGPPSPSGRSASPSIASWPESLRESASDAVMDAVEAILSRRSCAHLTGPAPNPDQLDLLLRAGGAAPDHGRLRPFRFTALHADGLDDLGRALEAAYHDR